MRQYEIGWADLPAPVGRRPVLLLTRFGLRVLEQGGCRRDHHDHPRFPQEVPVGEAEGLAPSVANFDNIHVVAKTLLSSRVGVLAAAREREVKRALGYALDWVELKTL